MQQPWTSFVEMHARSAALPITNNLIMSIFMFWYIDGRSSIDIDDLKRFLFLVGNVFSHECNRLKLSRSNSTRLSISLRVSIASRTRLLFTLHINLFNS